MSLERMEDFFNTRAESYDHHMLMEMALDEFYEEIARHIYSENPMFQLLDVGCGTGLELERIFNKYPNMSVTGVDLSFEMLKQLKDKYLEKKINLICGSYFTVPFGKGFEVVLSTYSLHHWSEAEKLVVYKKIFDCLDANGIFINGDYTCKTIEKQKFFQFERERLRKEQNLRKNEFYHYDTPLTSNTEIGLLYSAGFIEVELVKEWENTSVIIAKKEKKA